MLLTQVLETKFYFPALNKAQQPPAQNQNVAQNGQNGAAKPAENAVAAAEFGGWTIDNSRQRLNRFCMSERISCDFENIVEGTVTKTTISRLKLQIKALDQPLCVETRAPNKKQANGELTLRLRFC